MPEPANSAMGLSSMTTTSTSLRTPSTLAIMHNITQMQALKWRRLSVYLLKKWKILTQPWAVAVCCCINTHRLTCAKKRTHTEEGPSGHVYVEATPPRRAK